MNTKQSFLLFVFSLLIMFAMAQETALPVYKRFPTVPPFKIVKVPDSIVYKKENLKKKKATMVIIFSPDCDHCQVATKDLLANAGLFKKVQIVMASSSSYESIRQFYNEYAIAQHPNIIMGMDLGNFFSTFYSIATFPSIFLYDKKGVFVQKFEGSVPFSTIAASL
ncbi:MAG TPA: thioredoxin fold domain-containing protein [Ferruginibacter sp.]|nr:thioredoxin fold domain-containing protein [Ferruginibacter sp.]